MGVLWHGHYARLFELANEEIGRRCGLGYGDFLAARLRAPIVQLHVDYYASPGLGEQVAVVGRFLWNEGARIDIEYEVWRDNDALAATGYTVQMLVTDEGDPLIVSPELLNTCRERWNNGEFGEMQ